VLQNLNGAKYKIGVDNNGLLIANPVDGGEPAYYKLSDEDKAAIANDVIAKLPSDEWVLTFEDGTIVTKQVVIK
jgi:hypothetical protein